MTALAAFVLSRLDSLDQCVCDLRDRVEALEAKAKPGPSFTARAGETITIKCVIPNCEVCEARKP